MSIYGACPCVLEEDVTKENLEENFYECACHEGLQTHVWEAFEAKGSEYVDCLKSLDWEEVAELFCEGGGVGLMRYWRRIKALSIHQHRQTIDVARLLKNDGNEGGINRNG
ncbi:MAG: hypothetical protein EOL87_14225 [Spartobacteria bacterium]|nr:hypothetical protein [Spartobacteria bacterium]